MKKMIASLFFVAWFIGSKAQAPVNVITFNVRYNNPGDSANAWPFRKDFAASQILFHEAQIVGVQEALHGQMIDLLERLPAFRYVGVGRDDGKEKGEYSAIFYDSTRLKLLQTNTFWLSTTPEVPGSKGWDAAITRVVTWAKFRDKKTKKEFYAFNTHFDHIGKEARRESAKLLLQKVNEIGGKNPTVITGDFNSVPSDEPIQVITETANPLHLIDSKAVSLKPHYGPTGTFNGFTAKEINDNPIDYIFIKNKVKVLKHATLSQSWKGRFSSDHFPVFASLVIQ